MPYFADMYNPKYNNRSQGNYGISFYSLTLLLCILSFSNITLVVAQAQIKKAAKPKLVVGIVIDQMRWDYLYRFKSLYSTGGFNRLINEGFSCDNTIIPYIPTYTAPGHTCIYTGSIPAINGIVGNNWFERSINKNVYCTDDSSVSGVGSNSIWGKMSPKNLWGTTISDELRLSNNFQSRVIGISLKDRGAILPVGHSANAAYWYDDVAGKWISSTYYMQALPQWVDEVNKKNYPASVAGKPWETLLPIEKYTLSAVDNNKYENNIDGKPPVFPHTIAANSATKYQEFKFTPYAITYTFDMASAAITNEELGGKGVTDLLAVSISPTDYIGHSFGPNSIEIEDTYLRLDKDIEKFLSVLDQKFGKNNYLVFLTADHGVAHVPAFLQEHHIPAGVFNEYGLTDEINKAAESALGVKIIVKAVENSQVYINTDSTAYKNRSLSDIKAFVINYLKAKDYISDVYEMEKVSKASLPDVLKTRIINGFQPKRCGDIGFIAKPNYFSGGSTGTTHGSWGGYDAHIPLLWLGWNIKAGKTDDEIFMTDIAPTLAALLNIQSPSGNVGKVIKEVIQ
ncbi:MAG: alkaline phosphatase PafA [Ginsengibacter sp.]